VGGIKEKFLVINADDFGMDEQINRGIAESARQGIVRSVSLVANGAAFNHAVRLLQEMPGVAAGVHLCLTHVSPLLPLHDVSTLVDHKGVFPPGLWKKRRMIRLWGDKACSGEVRKEFEAQIQRVLRAGIIPTHLDAHQYVHLIPSIFRSVIELARHYNIRWIRYPFQRRFVFSGPFRNYGKILISSLLSGYQRAALRKNRIRFPDTSGGIATNGHLDEEFLEKFLRDLPPGFHDLTCHPGYFPEQELYRKWKYAWDIEKKALTSEHINSCVRRYTITLTNYAA
jgi:predicted glycoside hydrolase/deacetylase ChbG (UPF0249 family)